MTAPKITYGGALSALLWPSLADRLGWTLDAERPPDSLWKAARGELDLSPGERTLCAVALALWNGAACGVDVAKLGGLDSGAYGRLGRLLCAIEEGGGWERWAAREVARAELAVMDGGQKAPFDRQAFDDARRPYSRWVCPECNERWNEDMNAAGFVASGFDLPRCPECDAPAADDPCL
jgi:hypothetical protein